MPDQETEDKFLEVRCKICGAFLFEAEENSVGAIRVNCKKCKRKAKIRLSSALKQNSIYQIVSDTAVSFA